MRFYTGLQRKRGYNAQINSSVIAPAEYIPVSALAAAATYPDDVKQVGVFYHESEKLVRFLKAEGGNNGFTVFLDALSHGSRLDSALEKGFGSRFTSVDSLNQEFAAYAARPYSPLAGGN